MKYKVVVLISASRYILLYDITSLRKQIE